MKRLALLIVLLQITIFYGCAGLQKSTRIPSSISESSSVALSSRTILYRFDDGSFCTGFFIDDKTILTAANCLKRDSNPEYISLKIRNGLFITLKDYSLHVHPEYDRRNFLNDLMIIKLKKDRVRFPTNPPLKLVSSDSLEGIFTFSGFGGQRRKGINPEHYRRYVPLALAELQPPKSANAKSRLHFSQTDSNVQAICEGDGGGIVTVQRPAGTIEIMAVNSGYIPDVARGCDYRNRSVHVWLFPHLDWIESFGVSRKN